MILLVSLILAIAVFLLITEKLPLDLTAIGILVALTLTGTLTTQEAMAGFSNPSVITIGSLFILSRALMRTGGLGFVSDKLIEHSRGDEKRILLLVMLASAIPSAFINNTPVVVLFITVLTSVCCRFGLSPSKFLIPISYASILGGMTTLIGTSTNLISSGLSAKYGYGAFTMFELAPVGIPIMIVGILFLYFSVPKVMPEHKPPLCNLDEAATHYLAELLVPIGSRLIGRNPVSWFGQHYGSIELFELVRDGHIHFPDRETLLRMEPDDLLLVKGSANDLIALLDRNLVELPHKTEKLDFSAPRDRSLIAELVIPPQSRLIGEQPVKSYLQQDLGIQIIAVKRRGIHYSEQKIGDLRLSVGDTLLVHCPKGKLDEIRARLDFILLEEVHHGIVSRKKAPLAMAVFAAMILAASTGLADISVCAITAAFLMILTGCIRLRDAYRSLDVHVLMVLVAMLALGTAMEKTGAAAYYARGFNLLCGYHPGIVLAGMILLTCIMTEFMSNTATAVLLMPIAVQTAITLGVNPKPFIIGVCLGASCGFAVPIGYQTHLLIFGPGGYRFSDFLKLGIPMDMLTWGISSLLIPFIWPF